MSMRKYLDSYPRLVKEWHPIKNRNLKPEEIAKGNDKKFWWICSKGHEWEARITERTDRGYNCPKCSFQSSKPEFRILSELENLFFHSYIFFIPPEIAHDYLQK